VIEASAAVPAVAAAAVVVAAAAAAAAAASSSNQQQQDIPPLAGSGRNRNKMRKGSRKELIQPNRGCESKPKRR